MPGAIPADVSVGSARDATRRRRPRGDPEEVLCQRFLAVALCQAGRCGLSGEAAEDCALGFVAHAIRQLRRADAAPVTDAWLWRCALNWARNSRRSQRRRAYHERCFTDLSLPRPNVPRPAAPEQRVPQPYREAPTQALSPEDALLCRELRAYLARAILEAGLTPAQQQLLHEYYGLEESAVEIACRRRRSANAVRQELWSLRGRLRGALTALGMNREEARSYLACLASLPSNPIPAPPFLVRPSGGRDDPPAASAEPDLPDRADGHRGRTMTSRANPPGSATPPDPRAQSSEEAETPI